MKFLAKLLFVITLIFSVNITTFACTNENSWPTFKPTKRFINDTITGFTRTLFCNSYQGFNPRRPKIICTVSCEYDQSNNQVHINVSYHDRINDLRDSEKLTFKDYGSHERFYKNCKAFQRHFKLKRFCANLYAKKLNKISATKQ